jgi:membrane protein implicated in regulation of membrane protease activity
VICIVSILGSDFLFPSFGDLLAGIANWWSLALILATAGTLLWFVYSLWFRRLWRARRIANIRLKRMLEERDE